VGVSSFEKQQQFLTADHLFSTVDHLFSTSSFEVSVTGTRYFFQHVSFVSRSILFLLCILLNDPLADAGFLA
jgi:hypothetical protein